MTNSSARMRSILLTVTLLLVAVLLLLLRTDVTRLKTSLLFTGILGQAATPRQLGTAGTSAQGALSGQPKCSKALQYVGSPDEGFLTEQRLVRSISFLCEDEQDFLSRAEDLLRDGYVPTSLDAAQIGELLIRNNQIDRAISLLSGHPDISQRLVNLGRIEIEYNHDEQTALRYFEVANGVDPQVDARKSPMYLYLCLHAIREGENVILEAPCQNLFEVQPNETSRGLLARWYLMEEQFGEAVKFLSEAATSPDVSAETYFWLGTALKLQERNDEAREAFENGIRADPDLGMNYVSIGELLADQGCLESARQFLEAAIMADSLSEVMEAARRLQETFEGEAREDNACPLSAVP